MTLFISINIYLTPKKHLFYIFSLDLKCKRNALQRMSSTDTFVWGVFWCWEKVDDNKIVSFLSFEKILGVEYLASELTRSLCFPIDIYLRWCGEL